MIKKIQLWLTAVLLCSGSYSFGQTPTADFLAPASPVCSSQPVTFISTSTIGIGTISAEKWIFGTNPGDTARFNSSLSTPTFTFSDGNTNYLVQLIAFGPSGETDTFSRIVRVEYSPVAVINPAIPCFPNTVVLTDMSDVNDGFIATRNWQLAGLSGTNNVFNYNGAKGTFTATMEAITNTGCRDTAEYSFTYGDTPRLAFTPDGPITLCEGDSQLISITGADTYLWSNGDTGNSSTLKSEGVTIVTGSISDGCSSTESIEIISVTNPEADAGTDATILQGEQVTLNGSGGISYRWTPSDQLDDATLAMPVASPITTTTYLLEVSDDNGCIDTDEVTITVEQVTSLPIHNMITPNGDGFNDRWDLSIVPNLENADIYVFNRWGWEVFKQEGGYKNNWDGTFDGEPLPDGSYLYVIEVPEQEPIRGALQIIRNVQK